MIWRDVPGFEKLYEVSDNGLIRNWTTWHLIKPRKSSDGGLTVTLRCGKKKHKTFRINRLVALVYIPNPNSYKFVKPKNGDKENNTIKNLYWSRTKQDLPLKEVNLGCVYRNKKLGTMYHTIKFVRHSETQEIMVEYNRTDAMVGDIPWVRPLELFKTKFEVPVDAKEMDRGMVHV